MPVRKIILLHGAMGAASQFDKLKERLERDFDVLIPDFPGHGGRKIPDAQFSFPFFVSDIIGFLDEKKTGAADIFGYSMGGYAALWMAKNHPAHVNRIFTLATKFDWNEETAKREATMLNPDKIIEKIPAFADTLSKRHQPSDWKAVMQKTAEMLSALGKDHLEDDDFRSISHRVMIGIGDQDNMVSLAESEKVSKLLPNGSLHIFSSTPHPFEKADPQMLALEIKKFFT